MTLLSSSLRYCVFVCLEGLRKIMNNFSQGIPSPDRNLIPETFENRAALTASL